MHAQIVRDFGHRVTISQARGHSCNATFPSIVATVKQMRQRGTIKLGGRFDGRGLAELDEKFADQPVIDARLRATIGETYRKLGRYERAEPQIEAALATRKRLLGDDHPDTLISTSHLAWLYRSQDRNAEENPSH